MFLAYMNHEEKYEAAKHSGIFVTMKGDYIEIENEAGTVAYKNDTPEDCSSALTEIALQIGAKASDLFEEYGKIHIGNVIVKKDEEKGCNIYWRPSEEKLAWVYTILETIYVAMEMTNITSGEAHND